MAGWQDYGTDDGVLPADRADAVDAPALDPGTADLLARLRRLQAQLDGIGDALTLEQQAQRKISVILSQHHHRLSNLEATINTFMGGLIAATAEADEGDEISFAEAVRVANDGGEAAPRQRQIDVESMDAGDGTVIYRFKLPGRRSAKVTEYAGMAVGQAWIDEPSGERTPMKLVDAQDLLDRVVDVRRTPPGGDADPNFDKRVINPEPGVQ